MQLENKFVKTWLLLATTTVQWYCFRPEAWNIKLLDHML